MHNKQKKYRKNNESFFPSQQREKRAHFCFFAVLGILPFLDLFFANQPYQEKKIFFAPFVTL